MKLNSVTEHTIYEIIVTLDTVQKQYHKFTTYIPTLFFYFMYKITVVISAYVTKKQQFQYLFENTCHCRYNTNIL